MEPKKALKKLGIELPEERLGNPGDFVLELYCQKKIDHRTAMKYHDMVYSDWWGFSNLVEKAKRYAYMPLAMRIQRIFI